MGFRIALSPTYEVEVTVAYPVADGKVHKASFFAEFKRLSQAEVEQVMVDARIKGDREILNQVLVGWRGVQDENGNELPFNEANRDRFLSVHPAQPCTARAFIDSVLGAREKN